MRCLSRGRCSSPAFRRAACSASSPDWSQVNQPHPIFPSLSLSLPLPLPVFPPPSQDPLCSFQGRERYQRPSWVASAVDDPEIVSSPKLLAHGVAGAAVNE